MTTNEKEMTTVSVGAESRSGVPETSFNCVGCVGGDGKMDSGSVSDLSTQPSQPARNSENPDENAARLGTELSNESLLSMERQASHTAIRPAMPCDRRMQLARGAAPDPGEKRQKRRRNER